MVETCGTYDGQLRCTATHPDSGASFSTDAPKDNHGLGQSFSPTDLVGTAMGTCMLTIMGITAQRLKVDLKGSTFKVAKEMAAQPPRRIARLTMEFHLPASTSPENRTQLESAAMTCPVHKSLHPDIQTPIQFFWDL